MPRNTTAVATNIIKINIGKPKRKAQRKGRKPAPRRVPPTPANSPAQIVFRSPPTKSSGVYANQLRDIQVSQQTLNDTSKKNSDDIRRLTLLASSLRLPPSSSPPPTSSAPPRIQAPSTTPNTRKLKLASARKRRDSLLDSMRGRNLVGSNPMTSASSAQLGGGGTSYEDILKSRQEDFRRQADEDYVRQIDSYVARNDLDGLKKFTLVHGRARPRGNDVGRLASALKTDERVRRAYRGTFLKENTSTREFMLTPEETTPVGTPFPSPSLSAEGGGADPTALAL